MGFLNLKKTRTNQTPSRAHTPEPRQCCRIGIPKPTGAPATAQCTTD